jgi:hypothetical protein
MSDFHRRFRIDVKKRILRDHPELKKESKDVKQRRLTDAFEAELKRFKLAISLGAPAV